ncbi:MAG: hypothetical protein ABIE42_10210 [Candidatus Eisenbacteria bacterium]
MSKPRFKNPLDAGDPCPTCGMGTRYPLRVTGASRSYVECRNGHVFGRRVECMEEGCRRRATTFQWSVPLGFTHHCREHGDLAWLNVVTS